MSLVVFEHHPLETPVLLGSLLLNYGHRLRVVQLHAGDTVPADLDDVDGVLSMGGPMNVDQADEFAWIDREMTYLRMAHEAGVPCVGVCLGAQLIAAALGGKVQAMDKPEVGWHTLRLTFGGTIDPIFAGTPWQSVQFHMHGRHVTQLPPGGVPLASSKATPIQAFQIGLRTYGFQYHFEWDRRVLGIVADDALVHAAGVDRRSIIDGISAYYDGYRRLSDRLSHNIARLLLPVAK